MYLVNSRSFYFLFFVLHCEYISMDYHRKSGLSYQNNCVTIFYSNTICGQININRNNL